MPSQPAIPHNSDVVDQIRKMIRVQDATSMAGSLGRLVMGTGVCLGGGLVFATIIAIFSNLVFDDPWLGWISWFFIYFILLVPLLIWSERKTRTHYLLEAAHAVNANPSSGGEYKLDQFGVTVGAVASAISWGPRALLDGFRGLRGLRTGLQHAAFDRAAILVLDLSRAEGGIEIKRLLHPPEDMPVFSLAVDTLDKHGWIGKAGDGKSLWLNSTFREKVRPIVQR